MTKLILNISMIMPLLFNHQSHAISTILVPRPAISGDDRSHTFSCLIHNNTNKKVSIAFKDNTGDFLSADPHYIDAFDALKIQFPCSLEFFIWTGIFNGQYSQSGSINTEAEFNLTQAGDTIVLIRVS